MDEKILKITKIHKIKFKKSRDFCESIINDDFNLYFCTNNNLLNEYHLYKFDLITNKTKIIFKFPPKTIILGSKIKNNIFVGCVTSSNSIIVLDLLTKKYYLIKLKKHGCPNDVSYDNICNDIIWVVTNKNIPGENGILLKINIKTKKITNIDLGFAIGSVSGINIVNDHIYLACLTKIYKINKIDHKKNEIIIKDDPINKYFYDNISIYRNKLNIAIFDYQNSIGYTIITNKILLYISTLLVLLCIGDVVILNKLNINRKMSDSIIKFATYDLDTKKKEIYSFNKKIKNFDKTVTQINQIESNKFVLVNWKANCMVIVSTN
jgi:hypothetical protein